MLREINAVLVHCRLTIIGFLVPKRSGNAVSARGDPELMELFGCDLFWTLFKKNLQTRILGFLDAFFHISNPLKQ